MLVVKVGGSLGNDVLNVIEEVAALRRAKTEVLIVHGGSEAIALLGEKLGIPNEEIISPSGVASRRTTDQTMELILLALAGSVKPQIVQALGARGVSAMGLTGLDGQSVIAKRKTAIRAIFNGTVRLVRDDRSGKIIEIRADLLRNLLAAGVVPVLSPPAIDLDEGPVNVDADRLASAVAVALGASSLILLTRTPGMLRDREDPTSLISRIAPDDIDQLHAVAAGRMKHKIVAAEEAVTGGVERVIIADGRLSNPITAALAGRGTHIEAPLAARLLA